MTIEVEPTTWQPPGTRRDPPSYVHVPTFSQDMVLWALSHREAAKQLAPHEYRTRPAEEAALPKRFDDVRISQYEQAAQAAPLCKEMGGDADAVTTTPVEA